jgi:7,8-dihydroneopterin aldolase/epimerase/oxygenase
MRGRVVSPLLRVAVASVTDAAASSDASRLARVARSAAASSSSSSSSSSRRAFASSSSPAASSSSSAATPPVDKIHMRGMVFHAYHGVLPEEKTLGQKFVVDVAMSTCLRAAEASDDIGDTVDYARAFDVVKGEVTGASRDLIECVGGRVASALLRTFPSVADVRVGVRKPHVAVEGVLESLGVEVFRSRVGDRLP